MTYGEWEDEWQEWEDGYDAYLEMFAIWENPYNNQGSLWQYKSWEAGWIAAFEDCNPNPNQLGFMW